MSILNMTHITSKRKSVRLFSSALYQPLSFLKCPQISPSELMADFCDDTTDLKTFVECVKFARKMKDVAPFKDMVVAETSPGPNVTTDEQIGGALLVSVFCVLFPFQCVSSMLAIDVCGGTPCGAIQTG